MVFLTHLKSSDPFFQIFTLPPEVYEITETKNTLPSNVTKGFDEKRLKVFLYVQCKGNET